MVLFTSGMSRFIQSLASRIRGAIPFPSNALSDSDRDAQLLQMLSAKAECVFQGNVRATGTVTLPGFMWAFWYLAAPNSFVAI